MTDYKALYEELYYGTKFLLSGLENKTPLNIRKNARTIITLHKGRDGLDSIVTAYLADGLTDSAIAEKTGKHVRTIEGHVYRMLDRYGVRNRTQLAVKFFRNGWIK